MSRLADFYACSGSLSSKFMNFSNVLLPGKSHNILCCRAEATMGTQIYGIAILSYCMSLMLSLYLNTGADMNCKTKDGEVVLELLASGFSDKQHAASAHAEGRTTEDFLHLIPKGFIDVQLFVTTGEYLTDAFALSFVTFVFCARPNFSN